MTDPRVAEEEARVAKLTEERDAALAKVAELEQAVARESQRATRESLFGGWKL